MKPSQESRNVFFVHSVLGVCGENLTQHKYFTFLLEEIKTSCSLFECRSILEKGTI